MEVASTIIGTLSLGITVCNGVLQYCHSWKTQDDEVRALSALTLGLKELLEELEKRIQQPNPACDPRLLQRLNTSVKDCTRYIKSILQLSDKYTAGHTSGLKGKAKDITYKLTFPFKKKTLDELRDVMVAFRGNVETTLQVMTFDLALSELDAVQDIRRESSVMHTQVLSEIQDASTQITHSFAQELPPFQEAIISSFAQKIDHSTATLSQSSTAIHEDTQSSLLLLQRQTSFLQEQQLELKSLAQSVARLQPFHESTEDYCTVSTPNISLGSSKRRKRRRISLSSRRDLSGCNCMPTTTIVSYNAFFRQSLGKDSHTYTVHDRTCPLWFTSRKVKACQVSFALFRGLQIFLYVQVGINPHALMTGWSLTQHLDCRYVVPDNAPSFKVLRRHFIRSQGEESLKNCISSCIRDLKLVFQSGNGSPRDTLDDGCNLIDMAFSLLDENYCDTWGMCLLRLTKELIAMGVEFREGESSHISNSFHPFVVYVPRRGISKCVIPHRSPLSIISRQIFVGPTFTCSNESFYTCNSRAQAALDLLTGLAGEGIELCYLKPDYLWVGSSFKVDRRNSLKTIRNTMKSSEECAAAMECGKLSLAVLRQDLIAVKTLLEQRPGLLRTERNICGHTAIHLALGWTEGLKILLEAADESVWQSIDEDAHRLDKDYDSDVPYHTLIWSTPMDFAIDFGCVESIRLLADADIAFDFAWNFRVGTTTLHTEVSEIVLELIVRRFRELHDFSLQNLPAEVSTALQIESFEFFDANVGAVLDYFHTNNIQIPRKFRLPHNGLRDYGSGKSVYFCPSFGGIFHQSKISSETARTFYDAGFRGVDYEFEELTPLMTIEGPYFTTIENPFRFSRFFGMVDFLISKGARLYKQIPSRYIERTSAFDYGPKRNHRVIHRLASLCWDAAWQWGSVFAQTIDKECITTIARLGSSEIWHKIFGNNASDPCNCSCSLNGCRPIGLALKKVLRNSSWYTTPRLRKWEEGPQGIDIFEVVFILLENIEGQCIEADVIRFLTFTALGLTHTCCRHCDFTPEIRGSVMISLMDRDEIHEIHEEEVDLVYRLDCLVDEFIKQLKELELPLTTFLREHWQPRMERETLEKDIMSEETKGRLEELGVRILDHTSDSESNDDLESNDGYDSYDEWIENIAKDI